MAVACEQSSVAVAIVLLVLELGELKRGFGLIIPVVCSIVNARNYHFKQENSLIRKTVTGFFLNKLFIAITNRLVEENT